MAPKKTKAQIAAEKKKREAAAKKRREKDARSMGLKAGSREWRQYVNPR